MHVPPNAARSAAAADDCWLTGWLHAFFAALLHRRRRVDQQQTAARGSVTGRDVNNALSHIQTKMQHASQQPPVVSRGFASSHLVIVDALWYCERDFWFLHSSLGAEKVDA
jgi:hypothetical protein